MNRRTFLTATAGAAVLSGSSPRFDLSRIGANTCIAGWDFTQSIALIRTLGFATVELPMMGVLGATPGQFAGVQFDRISAADRDRIKAELRGFKNVSVHLPYTDLHYFSRFEPIAEFGARQLEIGLEGAAYFGARLAVLHPVAAAGMTLDEQWPLMIRRFRQWGDIAKRLNIKIALETGFPKSIAEFVRLIEEVDHNSVGATIDVGHQSQYAELVARSKGLSKSSPEAIRAYNDTTLEIARRLGKKTFHFHVHDIDPVTWKEHQPMRHGFVDYPRLFSTLGEIDYQGVLMLEIAGTAAQMPEYLKEAKQKLESWAS